MEDAGMVSAVLDSMVEMFLLLFRSSQAQDNIIPEMTTPADAQIIKIKLLKDIRALYSCGEADVYLRSEGAQQSAALFIYYGLQHVRGDATGALAVSLRNAMLVTLRVIVSSIGTRSIRLCFPGISSFVAKSMVGSRKGRSSLTDATEREEETVVGTSPLSLIVPTILRYEFYVRDHQALDWADIVNDATSVAESQSNTEYDKSVRKKHPIRLTRSLSLGVFASLLPSSAHSSLTGYALLMLLYTEGLLECLEERSDHSCDGTENSELSSIEWLSQAWPRVASHLTHALALEPLHVLIRWQGELKDEGHGVGSLSSTRFISEAPTYMGHTLLTAVLRLITILLNDTAVYSNSQAESGALAHLHHLYLFLWDEYERRVNIPILSGGSDRLLLGGRSMPQLLPTARVRLLTYSMDKLLPALLGSMPLFCDFLKSASLSPDSTSRQGEGGEPPVVILLLPAVRFANTHRTVRVSVTSPSSEHGRAEPTEKNSTLECDMTSIWCCPSKAFIHALCKRLCVFSSRVGSTHNEESSYLRAGCVEPSFRNTRIQDRGVALDSAASSLSVASSALGTRAMRDICEAVVLWLQNMRVSSLSSCDFRTGTCTITCTQGQPRPIGRDTATESTHAKENVLHSIFIPFLSQGILADWDEYAFHAGGCLLLGGLYDAMWSTPSKWRRRTGLMGSAQSQTMGQEADRPRGKTKVKGVFGGAFMRRSKPKVDPNDSARSSSLNISLGWACADFYGMAKAVNDGLVESEALWGSLSVEHLWSGVHIDWEKCGGAQRQVRKDNIVAITSVIAHCCKELAAEHDLLVARLSSLKKAHGNTIRDVCPEFARSSTREGPRAFDDSSLKMQISNFQRMHTLIVKASRRLSVLWMFQLLEKSSLQLPCGKGEQGLGVPLRTSTPTLVASMRQAATNAITEGIGLLGPIASYNESASGALFSIFDGRGSTPLQHESASCIVDYSRVQSRDSFVAAVILGQSELILDECARMVQSPSVSAKRLAYTFMKATIVRTNALLLSNESGIGQTLEVHGGALGPFIPFNSRFARQFSTFVKLITHLLRITREDISSSTAGIGMAAGLDLAYEKERIQCIEALCEASSRAAQLGMRVAISQSVGYLNIGALETAQQTCGIQKASSGGGQDFSGRMVDYVIGRVLKLDVDTGDREKARRSDKTMNALSKYFEDLGDAANSGNTGDAQAELEGMLLAKPFAVGSPDKEKASSTRDDKGATLRNFLSTVAYLQQELSEEGDSNRDELKAPALGLRELLRLISDAFSPYASLRVHHCGLLVTPDSISVHGDGQDSFVEGESHAETEESQSQPFSFSLRDLADSLTSLMDLVFALQLEALDSAKVLCLHVGSVVGRGRVEISSAPSQAKWNVVYPLIKTLRNLLEALAVPTSIGTNEPTTGGLGGVSDSLSSSALEQQLIARGGDVDWCFRKLKSQRVQYGARDDAKEKPSGDSSECPIVTWRTFPSQQWSTIHMLYGAVIPLLVTSNGYGLGLEHMLSEGRSLTQMIAERKARAAHTAGQLALLKASRGEEVPANASTSLSVPSNFPWPHWIRTLAVDAHHAAVIDFLSYLCVSAPSFTEARMCEEVAPLLLRVWYRRVVHVSKVRGSKEKAIFQSIVRFIRTIKEGGSTTTPSSATTSALFGRLVEPLLKEVDFDECAF